MTYPHCFGINTFDYGRFSELRENIKRFDSFSNFTFRTILRFRNMSFPSESMTDQPGYLSCDVTAAMYMCEDRVSFKCYLK